METVALRRAFKERFVRLAWLAEVAAAVTAAAEVVEAAMHVCAVCRILPNVPFFCAAAMLCVPPAKYAFHAELYHCI